MGFFTKKLLPHKGGEDVVAIPFRVGWGFSPFPDVLIIEAEPGGGRNPFQGGMGFFTLASILAALPGGRSQSLSGWDGVFHPPAQLGIALAYLKSQSLSGWDGVFHR